MFVAFPRVLAVVFVAKDLLSPPLIFPPLGRVRILLATHFQVEYSFHLNGTFLSSANGRMDALFIPTKLADSGFRIRQQGIDSLSSELFRTAERR